MIYITPKINITINIKIKAIGSLIWVGSLIHQIYYSRLFEILITLLGYISLKITVYKSRIVKVAPLVFALK